MRSLQQWMHLSIDQQGSPEIKGQIRGFNLTLLKPEEAWGKSYLAVACGTVTVGKTKEVVLSPETISRATARWDSPQAFTRF